MQNLIVAVALLKEKKKKEMVGNLIIFKMICDRCKKEINGKKFRTLTLTLCKECYKMIIGETHQVNIPSQDNKLPAWLDPNKKGDTL